MPKRVAVVVIHGVADQERCSSARAAADLLRNASEDWGDFVEDEVRVKVEAVRVEDRGDPFIRFVDAHFAALGEGFKAAWVAVRNSQFLQDDVFRAARSAGIEAYRREAAHQERRAARRKEEEEQNNSAAISWWRQTPAVRAKDENPSDSYMWTQLSKWKPSGKETTYRATRLRGRHARANVDASVYEMHWADLSRLDSAIWRPFAEAFQLIFYLASLGRWTVEQEPPPSRRAWAWEPFLFFHIAAEKLLVQFVPLLNLIEFAAILPLVAVCKVPVEAMAPGLAGAAGLAPLVLLVLIRRVVSARRWPSALVATLVVGAGAAAWAWDALGHADVPFAFGLTMLGLGLCGVGWIAAQYDRRFPGAMIVFCLIMAFVVIRPIAPASLPWGDSVLTEGSTTAAAIWQLVDRLQRSLKVVWLVTFVATGGSLFFGAFSWGRAVWTGWATLVLSITLAFCLNIGTWQLAQTAVTTIAPEFRAPEAGKPGRTLSLVLDKKVVSVGDKWEELMKESAVGPLIATAFFLVAFGFLAWSLLPATLAELGRRGTSKERDSVWLGESLSAAFRTMWVGAIVLIAGIVAVGAEASKLLNIPWLHQHAFEWTAVFGIIAAGLLLGKGPLESGGLAFRQVLDVILDVVNWIRLHPLEENVRARVCGRYVSLLRHLLRDGEYDSIVILAHSQGTVITADLLRFLHTVPTRAQINQLAPLRDIPLTVFSMGCPLRQLYRERFPTQYQWADESNDWTKELLGVNRWVNAYAAGDYVGRNLWPGTAETLWEPAIHAVGKVQGGAREFCIGEGAHLGYWEPEQVAIREVLQAMVLGTADGVAISAKAP